MPQPFIGNDIVDLIDEANRQSFQRPGYIDRCCSADEINWLSQQADAYTAFWSLWAAKEASYKVAIKAGIPAFRNPTAIAVTLEKTAFMAQIHTITCYGSVSMRSDYVHAVAANCHPIPEFQLHISQQAGNDGSTQAQAILIELAAQHGLGNEGQLTVEKNQQAIPQLCSNGLPLPVDVSISHDGNWVAVACMQYEQ